ncbi:hypothetical protein [Litchfieldia alkalitelluris]|uniref:hypothetical protein n=1 Tax=Litchfieldia alkalitelluris TaxID=304268 RepID=UPI001959B104|nr:hypothetical protein [Litchfieldia alkalitelluris]
MGAFYFVFGPDAKKARIVSLMWIKWRTPDSSLINCDVKNRLIIGSGTPMIQALVGFCSTIAVFRVRRAVFTMNPANYELIMSSGIPTIQALAVFFSITALFWVRGAVFSMKPAVL